MSVRQFALGIVAFGVLISACAQDAVVDPDLHGQPADPFVVSADGPLGPLPEAVADAPQRVEIKVYREGLEDGTLIAREVEIEDAEDLADEEEIEARVVEIEDDGAGTHLVTEIGGVRVTVTSSTRFRDFDGTDLSMDDFLAAVQDAIDAGEMPFVEAERNPAAEPQDPDDGEFIASKVELEDDDEPEIEINIDADNVEELSGTDPDGLLHVLGISIELRVTDGLTEVEHEQPDDDDDDENDDDDNEGLGESRLEEFVASADPANGTVTLDGGTVVVITASTEVEEPGNDRILSSVDDVAIAVESGRFVRARVRGARETSAAADSLFATRAEFEIMDHDDLEFQGDLDSVDPAAGTVTLADGTLIRVDKFTEIKDGSDRLTSLSAAEQALADGHTVEVKGKGAPARDDATVVVAAEIEFEPTH